MHVGGDGWLKTLDFVPRDVVHLREVLSHGEVEYFLGKRPDESDIYGASERGYHASSPFVLGEPLRRLALVALSEMGVPVKYGHSEVGYIPPVEGDDRIWEQHEPGTSRLPVVGRRRRPPGRSGRDRSLACTSRLQEARDSRHIGRLTNVNTEVNITAWSI